MRRRINILLSVVLAVAVLCGVVAVNAVALHWDSPLQTYLGVVGEGVQGGDKNAKLYKSDYKSAKELRSAQEKFAEDAVSEGTVLLKNDGSLPLKKNAKISLFGIASAGAVTTGGGSGEVKGDKSTLQNSLSSAGFKVNNTLAQFYASSKHKHGSGTGPGNGDARGDWKLDEVPQSEYSPEVKKSYGEYDDAAIVVFSRKGGEGGDLPTEMSRFGGDAERGYLHLSAEEEQLLQSINASGEFKTTVVLINSPTPMELGFADQEQYGVKGILWYAGTGINGIAAIGKILNGSVNPSGKTVDTYAYDSKSAPAMQNFGDFRYVDGNGNLVKNSYLSYSEGIYVGYRYYETRYEDQVMGRPNVGDYRYDKQVQYPFGYGLSYTTFDWSRFKMSKAADVYNIEVSVKNTGKKAGKDVVEIYAQLPYQQGGIQSSAVDLADFKKTKLLQPGESETVKLAIPANSIKAYDYIKHKTYIQPAGNYYLTAAKNAHEAVNNILLQKGTTNIIGEGNKDMVGSFAQSDEVMLSKGDKGKAITNRFDDVALKGVKYLDRSDWKMMDNNGLRYATGSKEGVSNVTDVKGTVGTVVADADLISKLSDQGYKASGAPDVSTFKYPKGDSYTYDANNGLKLSDMIGLKFDDPKWEKLLDELKLSQMHQLFNKSGYGTMAIEKINKPKTYEYDGPAGITNMITGKGGFGYPSSPMIAATWNKDIAKRMGSLMGEDGLTTKTSGWYAPAVNIHRTPYSGRNFEYFSEDPVVAGLMSAEEIKAVQNKGVYVYLKHFALNDQETNRSANGHVAIWSNEQAIREIYLKPFELGVERGHAKGIMTALNRIGARPVATSYPLLTAVARGEWGFDGIFVTDYSSAETPAYADGYLAAGGNLFLATAEIPLTDAKQDWTRAMLRNSAHRVLYVIANSLAMNDLAGGGTYHKGFPIYQILLIALDVLLVVFLIFAALRIRKTALESDEQFGARMARTKKRRMIIYTIVAVVIIVGLVAFYILAWPLIQNALLM